MSNSHKYDSASNKRHCNKLFLKFSLCTDPICDGRLTEYCSITLQTKLDMNGTSQSAPEYSLSLKNPPTIIKKF